MKHIRFRIVFAALLFLTLLIGCGGSHEPIAGGLDAGVAPAAVQQPAHLGAVNRVLWGLWKVSISADTRTVTVVPDRAGALHLNVVRLLEVVPCSDCLTINNLQVIPDGLSADVTLTHPFPELLRYAGFDVRGILISGARYTFPASGGRIAWGDDVARMLNPDGYTHLFSPTNFSYMNPPILGYIPGHKAPGGDLSATLNPYVAYERDKPRCVFMPGTASTRTVLLHVPAGPLEFGYAVDASWCPPGVEVTDPVNDFPPEANSMEAYRVDVRLDRTLGPLVGSAAEVQVEVFDHQGLESIGAVTIEAPDVFSGERALSFSTAMGEESFLFTGIVTNELGPGYGAHPLLVRISDTETDQNLGAIDAWQVAGVRVREGWARIWDAKEAVGVAVDGTGNVYVTGYFRGIAGFGEPHISNGLQDVFLGKLGSSGEFLWARTWGGPKDDRGFGVAVDGAGNVYVTGSFEDTVDFDPDGGNDPHTSNGGSDVFLSKFDPSGDFKWARTWGGTGVFDGGYGIAADGLGNVYVTGEFYQTVDFDPGGGDPHSSSGSADVFLSRFDSSGDFDWARTWGAAGQDQGRGAAIDGSSNVYVAGWFGGTVDFDPGGGDPHTSNGSFDVFLSEFDSSGDFKWARTWGGTSGDGAYGVAADSSGSVYVTGYFQDTVDFDPEGGDPHKSKAGEDAFLSKFDSSGNFHWARTWGGGGVVDEDESYAVASDSSGNVYATGWFQNKVCFDPGGGDPHTAKGSFDVFLSKFDSSGNFQWARTWGGYGWDRGGCGVATDRSGNTYVTGSFYSDPVNFAPSGPPCGEHPDEYTSSGGSYAFVSKHLPDGCW